MNLNKTLLEAYCRPIAVHPIYFKITGSVKSGVLLSQMIYWWFAMKEEAFYKTDEDFMEELCMNRKEFKNAKNKLVTLGIIEYERQDWPAKTYYYVDIDKVIEIVGSVQLCRKGTSVVPKGNNRRCRKGTTHLTENTTENTQILAPTVHEDIVSFINLFKGINPVYKDWYKNTTQRAAAAWLIENMGMDYLRVVMAKLPEMNAEKYWPTSTTPVELKINLARYKAKLDEKKSTNKIVST